MTRSPQSLYWQITGLVSTLWFLHSCWLIPYLSLCIIFQTIRFNRDYQGIVTLLLNYHGHDHLLFLLPFPFPSSSSSLFFSLNVLFFKIVDDFGIQGSETVQIVNQVSKPHMPVWCSEFFRRLRLGQMISILLCHWLQCCYLDLKSVVLLHFFGEGKVLTLLLFFFLNIN